MKYDHFRADHLLLAVVVRKLSAPSQFSQIAGWVRNWTVNSGLYGASIVGGVLTKVLWLKEHAKEGDCIISSIAPEKSRATAGWTPKTITTV